MIRTVWVFIAWDIIIMSTLSISLTLEFCFMLLSPFLANSLDADWPPVAHCTHTHHSGKSLSDTQPAEARHHCTITVQPCFASCLQNLHRSHLLHTHHFLPVHFHFSWHSHQLMGRVWGRLRLRSSASPLLTCRRTVLPHYPCCTAKRAVVPDTWASTQQWGDHLFHGFAPPGKHRTRLHAASLLLPSQHPPSPIWHVR